MSENDDKFANILKKIEEGFIKINNEDEKANIKNELLELIKKLSDCESNTILLNNLLDITVKINQGMTIDEILGYIYDIFKKYIPYNRIGLSLIDKNGKDLVACCTRSDSEKIRIEAGYRSTLEGSSLESIIRSGNPRIINDLEEYYRQHPDSESTGLILEEGILSSLTCPLITNNRQVGFMFFSSRNKNTYRDEHMEIYVRLANQVSLIIEKARVYEELIDLNELKNKFIGMVAHDLRNPISVIKGSAEILHLDMETKTDIEFSMRKPQIENILNIVGKQCKKMLMLIDDLLDISAIESGNVKIEKVPTDISLFLDQIIENNKVIAEVKNILITGKYQRNIPLVNIDIRRMEQVMDNLITNAVKFSNPGTEITVKSELQAEKVIISVIDQGQGIPEDELSKVFLPFSRTSVMPTAGEKGTGLGLAISKKIVELHNGKIWVESEVGKGTIFTFSIPI